jgi:hypothetical protein
LTFFPVKDLEFFELKLSYRLYEYDDEKSKAAKAAALYFLKL